jgi:hypothetical protein
MSKYKHILGLDPSGNWNEGKGTTGYSLLDENLEVIELGELKAKDYKSQQDYWQAHIDLIDRLGDNQTVLVIEDYILYANKADSQIGSKMETPQLLGVLKYFSNIECIDTVFQPAHMVKNRWDDPILEHKGYLMKTKNNRYLLLPVGTTTNGHMRDALRHALHYGTFYNKEE